MPKDALLSSRRERCQRLCHSFSSNKNFLLLFVTVLGGFYWFGLRPVMAVQQCHAAAQQNARAMIQQRLRMNPQNPQLQQAAQAGMIAEEDYASAYRNCMRNWGYAQ